MAKTLSRKVTIYVNGKEVESTIKSLSAELEKLKKQQAKMTIGTREYIETGLKIKEITDVLNDQKNAMKKNNGEWEHAVEMVSRYSNVVMGAQSAFQVLDSMTGRLKDLASEAAEMDDVYSDVQKTTGLTREDVARLNEEFKKIDTRTSREELNKLAYEAGKLGINSLEGVLQFVRASDKINIALGDVLGDGAMVAIGKMADVYTQSTEELKAAGDDLEKKMLAIGSAVNQLGQESTANEHYMVDFTARMGGIAVQANMSAGQVLGFASALDQSMQKVEMSATAFQKFIGQVMKNPEEFAKQANMSVQEFDKLVRTDLNEALLRVLEGFKGKGGYAELVNIFKNLGLDGARAATVISSMANNIEKITDAQWIANEQLRERNSIEDEFDKKNNNRQAEREKSLKDYNDMCERLGNVLYPVLIRLTKLGTGMLKVLAAIVDIIKEDWKYSLVLVGVLGTLMRTRIALTVATLRERLAIEGNIFARSKETRETRRTQLALAKEQVERLKALKSRLQERIAINNTVLAKRQELVASGQLNVVYAAEAKAKRFNVALTKTENMLLDAQKSKTIALSAVMRSTPWGLVATGVAVVVGWLIKHNSKLDEAKQKERELAAEEARVAESSSKAKVEIERYTQRIKERLEKGGEETTLLNALNTKYGEIFGTYDTLAKWYDVLVSKVEDYVQALLLEAKAKKSIDNAAEMDAQIEAYKKMKAESIEEVETLNRLQKAWYNLRANAYGVRQKVGGFFSGGTPNMPGRIFDWEGAKEGWRNNGPQQEVDRLWNTYYDNLDRQKERVIAGMEEVRDGYIRTSEEMLKESAELQAKRGFKIVGEEFVSDGDMPTGSSGNTGGETAKEREKRLRKASKDWENAQKQANKLIESTTLKAGSGIEKEIDAVTAKYDEMEKSILSAAAAVGKVKFGEDGDVKTMTEDVAEVLGRLAEAELKLKQSEADKYINKLTETYSKMADRVGDADGFGRLTAESDRLRDSLGEIDKAILQAEADLGKVSGSQRQELQWLIDDYKELKSEITGELLQRQKDNPPLTEVDFEQQWNEERQEFEMVPKLKVNKSKLQKMGEDAAKGLQDAIDGIEIEAAPFEKWCDAQLDLIENFASRATSILSSINTILDNIGDQELVEMRRRNEEESATLDEQLEQQLISQEEYNQRKKELNDEYNDKEKEIRKEQWVRNKLLSAGEATIEGALAVLKALNDKTIPSTAARIAMAATVGALTAAQILAVTSQPEPYARGGYVPRRTVYQAGEAGPEWVASNSLLTDPVAAPIIEQLEAYQRGNRRALADIPMAQLNMPVATRAARELGRRRSLSENRLSEAMPAINPNVSVTMPWNDEMIQLWRELATYLKDPKNRQAVISRQRMEDFEKQEQFLLDRARLQ